jgi:hypothetical protein
MSGGIEAKPSYLGHVLIENRNALIVDAMLTTTDGTAEAAAALLMADALRKKRPGGPNHSGRRQGLRSTQTGRNAVGTRHYFACGSQQQAAPERD